MDSLHFIMYNYKLNDCGKYGFDSRVRRIRTKVRIYTGDQEVKQDGGSL